MGAGKTLTQTQLAWKNWFTRRMKLYSNYHLYKVPYYFLETIRQLDYCHDGAVVLDEIWRILDSRLSRKASNKVVSDVLARSRKRKLIYIFTAQVIDTIDKRVRKVTDFTAYPMLMGKSETTVKSLVFRTAYPRNQNFMKTFYFDTWLPMSVYNSYEEVDMIDDTDEENPPKEPKLMWQEGTFRCAKCKFVMTQTDPECPQCQSKDLIPIEPIFFDTWEEADRHGSEYWERLLNREQVTDTEEDGI
jgi:hypothetical protein